MKRLFFIISTAVILSACSKANYWTRIEKNYSNEIVPRGLFLINNEELYLGARQGLFKLDSTGSFVHIPAPVRKDVVLRSFVKCNKALFAGYEGGGLFRSMDNGKTWKEVGKKQFDSNKLWGLFTYDSTVIAVTWPRYIYSTTDNGKTWEDISNGMPEAGSPGVCGGHSQGMILKDTFLFCSLFNEGVFRKGVNEKSWTPARTGLPNDFKTRGICEYNNRLFVGTENGVYKSDNNGLDWMPVNEGMENVMIICFWADKTGLYAGSNKGQLFKSINNGKTWSDGNKGLHSKDVIYDIKKLNDIIYLSIDGQGETPSGVYRSETRKR